MAKNVHEVWAKTRVQYDDEQEKHPCLVSDCKISQEILKFIMEKGFRIVKKKSDFLHSIKEFLLNIESKLSFLFTYKFTGKKHFRRNKSFIRYSLLMICFVLTMLTGIMLANIFPNLSKIILSFSVFIAGCYLVLLTYRPIFGRYYIRNAFFCFIFILGVIVYGSMHHHGFLTVDSQVKETGWLRFETKLFEAIDRGNHAIAAFFPSRGEYEALVDNSENKIEEATISEKQVYSRGFMRLYLLFHILVYLFFGYFTLTLWGHRLISRLNFFLVLDKNKNIFWCEEPNDKMLLLARDIYKTCEEEDVTFSVSEHKNGGSAKELYQNMNFMGFSLKLRKEEQIHNGCLHAKKHFFISDDSDWNIDMAKRFLMQREEKRINNKSKLYIKISNDARKKYFENWADDLNKKLMRKIEIHFFDDSLLIARKFIENNPMYECIKKKKQPGKPYFEFGTTLKVLIIGFGEYGHAILDHIACDSQYLACDTKGENKKRVKFSADIIEKDMQKCKYYESRLPDVCKRFNYKFIQNIADIQTAEFYNFMKKEINNYDRIVVALGNDYLNLECGIVLKTIARKSVKLNSKKEIDELKEFKNKIFILQEKNIPKCENNLFTIFGNLDTIFTNEVITDEAMDEQAKLVNYVYEYI